MTNENQQLRGIFIFRIVCASAVVRLYVFIGLLRGEVFNSCAATFCHRYVAMTIAGLWPFLRQRGFVREVHGAEARELLHGKRIAIDVAFWAVQGDVAESVTKRCQHFLLISFWRVCRYLRIGAFPFAVLDAPSGPSWKRRRRRPDGQFSHDVRMIKDLFAALGCPTLQASGEAEAGCSSMTALGVADAIESGDGDVFAFGGSGLLLKSVGGDGSGAWSLEVIDMDKVSTALGVGRQGWIAIAALSGCDCLPGGAGRIGIEKAIQCARAMLSHCGDEVSLNEFILAALEGGLPDELRVYASLSGCKTSIQAWSAESRCYCVTRSVCHRVCVCVCVCLSVCVGMCWLCARPVEWVQAMWTWIGRQVVAWQPWMRSVWYRAQLGWTWWLQATGSWSMSLPVPS